MPRVFAWLTSPENEPTGNCVRQSIVFGVKRKDQIGVNSIRGNKYFDTILRRLKIRVNGQQTNDQESRRKRRSTIPIFEISRLNTRRVLASLFFGFAAVVDSFII